MLLRYKWSRAPRMLDLHRRSLKKFILLWIVAILLLLVYLLTMRDGGVHLTVNIGLVIDQKQEQLYGFVVNTPGCKIPDVDPFDKSIHHLINAVESVKCNATPALTYVDDSWLRINRTALKLHYVGQLKDCIYETVHRPNNDDTMYFYGNTTIRFKDDLEIKCDFIRVACYMKNGDMVYVNFHTFIHDKPHVEARCEKQFPKYESQIKPREQLNLLLIGVDSVSRLNMARQMSKTRKYLLKELNAIELKGYNKVADNTYVNLVPMMAGKLVEELPWSEDDSSLPFDNYTFVWNTLSDYGFRTLYAEDAPYIAIFNYVKEGFHTAPTDYYLRPFSLAMENHGSIWKNDHHCVGPKLETEVVLDYVHDFMVHFRDNPKFAFAFLTRLTHEYLNKAGAADEPYLNFIKRLHQKGVLENTVLIFFSDHGIRFGPIRETYIGKLEERLPFMFLAFPTWFYQKYPHFDKNLRINVNRLTTPFDIYETLVDIINFQPDPKVSSVFNRGNSLFSEIPPERTCDQAGIEAHWCTCHQQQRMPTDDPQVTQAANAIVTYINDQLVVHGLACAQLRIEEITDALMIIASDKLLRFRASVSDVIGRVVNYGPRVEPIADYLLTIRTAPGGGLFEATVRHSAAGGDYHVQGDISRINLYGHQSDCIDYHRHKKYCYCL